MVSPDASPVPVISMAPSFVGVPCGTKPVGATDCTMADTALDGPLVSVLSTLVSVAVMLEVPSKNVADVTMSKAPLTPAKPLPTTVLPL